MKDVIPSDCVHLHIASVSILFYDAKSFFMQTTHSVGAGGEVAQSIKAYSRCTFSLDLFFRSNDWKT